MQLVNFIEGALWQDLKIGHCITTQSVKPHFSHIDLIVDKNDKSIKLRTILINTSKPHDEWSSEWNKKSFIYKKDKPKLTQVIGVLQNSRVILSEQLDRVIIPNIGEEQMAIIIKNGYIFNRTTEGVIKINKENIGIIEKDFNNWLDQNDVKVSILGAEYVDSYLNNCTQICPTCKGSKTIKITVSERGEKDKSKQLKCVDCEGIGRMTTEDVELVKARAKIWCKCGSKPDDTYYVGDGKNNEVSKHHWRCSKCDKVKQIG